MTPEQATALREPFPTEVVGKLPRITCRNCSSAGNRVCSNHTKSRCERCRSFITTAHMHLDFVGHAETTDRLLRVDPEWTWEPVAFGEDGLPKFDSHGGLWLRLTVAGVTRLGYGHADGKSGPDATKECIGDGIRNSAMRFGVAIDLWGAHGVTPAEDPSEPVEDRPAEAQQTGQAGELRARIAREAQALGYDIDDVPGMFTAVMRQDIRNASPATLSEFLHVHVKNWKQVVDGAE